MHDRRTYITGWKKWSTGKFKHSDKEHMHKPETDQENKTRKIHWYNKRLSGEGNHLESCKKLKFDHANKYFKHNSEFARVNETRKIPRDFVIKTCHAIPVKNPDLKSINKKMINHPIAF